MAGSQHFQTNEFRESFLFGGRQDSTILTAHCVHGGPSWMFFSPFSQSRRVGLATRPAARSRRNSGFSLLQRPITLAASVQQLWGEGLCSRGGT
jgi:hypothetical protein